MRGKINKILLYLDLADYSKEKYENIKTSVFYKIFPDKQLEHREELSFQRKVTNRLEKRIQKLIKEL